MRRTDSAHSVGGRSATVTRTRRHPWGSPARGAGRPRLAPIVAAGLWLAVAGSAADAAPRPPAKLVVNVDVRQTARPISEI